MKKILLVVAALCCMMPVMAQKNSEKTPAQQMKESKQKVELLNRKAGSYTQKLDSVIYSNGAKIELAYDQHYNCTKLCNYSLSETGAGWDLELTNDYVYDAQNRIISITNKMEDYISKETWEYDENGNIAVQTIYSDMLGTGELVAIHKMVYTYDAQGHVTEIDMYGIEDDMESWYIMQKDEYTYNADGQPLVCLFYMYDYTLSDLVLDTKTEWIYNGQQCIAEESYFMEYDAWVLNNKTTYAYDNNGNVVEEIYYRTMESEEGLVYSWKTEYQYDNHNNVTKVTEYSYENQDWEFSDQSEMTYNQQVSVDKVAGLLVIFDFDDVSQYFKDQILTITNTDADEAPETITFHYSAATNVNEFAENQCVIWPNPTTEVLNINGANLLQAEIYSIDGKLVMTLGEGTESVNVSGLERGNYLLKATLKDGSVSTQKFVKK